MIKKGAYFSDFPQYLGVEVDQNVPADKVVKIITETYKVIHEVEPDTAAISKYVSMAQNQGIDGLVAAITILLSDTREKLYDLAGRINFLTQEEIQELQKLAYYMKKIYASMDVGPNLQKFEGDFVKFKKYVQGIGKDQFIFENAINEFSKFTPGTDNITGDDFDNFFYAPMGRFNQGDVVDGKGGFDKLVATLQSGVITPIYKKCREHHLFRTIFEPTSRDKSLECR